jgi:hemolysin D
MTPTLNFDPVALSEEPSGETARPLSYGLIVITIALVAAGLTWLRLDVIVHARGRIVPKHGGAGVVSSIDGRVARVLPRNGEYVAAGALLFQLDDTELRAEHASAEIEIRSLAEKISLFQRLDEVLSESGPAATRMGELGPIPTPPAADGLRRGSLRLDAYVGEFNQRVVAGQHELEGHIANSRVLAAELKRLRSLRALGAEQLALIDEGYRDKVLSKLAWLTAHSEALSTSEQIAVLEERLAVNSHAIAESEARQRLLQMEYRKSWNGERFELEQRLDTARERLKVLEHRLSQGAMHTPVAGIFEEITPHRVGAFVEAGQPLARVVPIGDELVADVSLENADIGAVRVGQAAQIKIDAYPFTKYGVTTGRVTFIGRDSSAKTGQADVYRTVIDLDGTHLKRGHARLELVAGMSMSAEINIGTRRLVEYFIGPLEAVISEAFHER